MKNLIFFSCSAFCFFVSCVDVYMGIRWELTYETELNPIGKWLISWIGVSCFLFFRLVTSAIAVGLLVFMHRVKEHRKWIRVSSWGLLAFWTFSQTLLLIHFQLQGVLL